MGKTPDDAKWNGVKAATKNNIVERASSLFEEHACSTDEANDVCSPITVIEWTAYHDFIIATLEVETNCCPGTMVEDSVDPDEADTERVGYRNIPLRLKKTRKYRTVVNGLPLRKLLKKRSKTFRSSKKTATEKSRLITVVLTRSDPQKLSPASLVRGLLTSHVVLRWKRRRLLLALASMRKRTKPSRNDLTNTTRLVDFLVVQKFFVSWNVE